MSIADVIRIVNEMAAQGVVESYAIGGAVGSTFYLEPVANLDLDVFVKLRQIPGQALIDPTPIFAYLGERGHPMEGEYVMVGDWPVRFLAPPGQLGTKRLSRL